MFASTPSGSHLRLLDLSPARVADFDRDRGQVWLHVQHVVRDGAVRIVDADARHDARWTLQVIFKVRSRQLVRAQVILPLHGEVVACADVGRLGDGRVVDVLFVFHLIASGVQPTCLDNVSLSASRSRGHSPIGNHCRRQCTESANGLPSMLLVLNRQQGQIWLLVLIYLRRDTLVYLLRLAQIGLEGALLLQLLLLTILGLSLSIFALLSSDLGKFVEALEDIVLGRLLGEDARLAVDILFIGSTFGVSGSKAAATNAREAGLIDLGREGALLRFILACLLRHLLKFDSSLLRFADQEVLVLAAYLPQSGVFAQLLTGQVIGASGRAGVACVLEQRLLSLQRLGFGLARPRIESTLRFLQHDLITPLIDRWME